MPDVKLLQRVTLDGHKTIHEIGEIITATEDEVAQLVKVGAARLVPERKPAKAAKED